MKELIALLDNSFLPANRFRLRFNHCKGKVAIESDNVNILVHIKAYLHYQMEEGESSQDWRIQAISHYQFDFKELFQEAEKRKMEYDDYGLFTSFGNWQGIWNQRTQGFIFINIVEKKAAIYNSDVRALFIDAYKSVRQIITSESILHGAVPVHCSCLSIGGQGIMFMGDKGSGKTTLVTASLLTQGRLANYLANDRMLAYPEEGRVDLYSWPTVLGIGPGAMHYLTAFAQEMRFDLHDRAGGTAKLLYDQELIGEKPPFDEVSQLPVDEQWGWPKKLWITPMEVATACNTNLGTSTKLSMIVFPTLRPGTKTVTVERVSLEECKEILSQNLLLDLPFYPNWMGLPFVSKEDFDEAVAALGNTLNDVPAYRISGGADTESVVKQVFSLLEGLESTNQ